MADSNTIRLIAEARPIMAILKSYYEDNADDSPITELANNWLDISHTWLQQQAENGKQETTTA